MIEFIAQIIHEYHHPLGFGQTCDKCTAVATIIFWRMAVRDE